MRTLLALSSVLVIVVPQVAAAQGAPPEAPPAAPGEQPPPAGQPGAAPAGQPSPAATPAAPPAGPAPVYMPPPPAPPAEPPGVRTHDGFYARMSLGGGYVRGDGEVTGGPLDLKYTLSGGTVSLDLAFGGSPIDGLVMGGAYWFNQATSPKIEFEGGSQSASDLSLNFGIIGPFVDIFPDPHGGLHFGAIVGLAAMTVSDDSGSTKGGDRGFGGGLFAGYDFWISDQWSLGAYLRGAGASVSNSDSGTTEKITVSNFAVMLSALYH